MAGNYSYVPNEYFKEKMSDIYNRYYTRGERKYNTLDREDLSLMYTLIKELEEYTNRGLDIRRFVSNWGSAQDKYVSKKDQEYQERLAKEGKTGGGLLFTKRDILLKAWSSEWDNAARKEEYLAKIGVPDFIEEVEGILNGIRDQDRHTLYDCDAIKQLTNEKTNLPDIDDKNLKLLELYNKMIKEDLDVYGELNARNIENSIQDLKLTSLYKYHGGVNPIRDNRHIGKDASTLTFSEVFDKIRSFAKKYNSNLVTNHTKSNPEVAKFEESDAYSDKIRNLGNLIASLTSGQEERINAKDNECILNSGEQKYLSDLESSIGAKIDELKLLYDGLKTEIEGREKDLMYIDAFKARIKAISTSEIALLNNSNFHFAVTLRMLKEEKEKSYNSLNKYNQLINKLDGLCAQIPSNREILELIEKYGEVIDKGRKRKDLLKKDAELEQKYVEHNIKVHQANIDAMKEEDLLKLIDDIKARIQSRMNQTMGESVRNFVDTDHMDNYYSEEYREEFINQLSTALREHNIPIKAEYFSIPGEKVEYHIAKPEEKMGNGLQMFQQDEHGKYIIHYDDYENLFNKFEKQLLEEKGKCTYNDVFWKIEDFLGSRYYTKLANSDDFQEIINSHHSEYKERQKKENEGYSR